MVVRYALRMDARWAPHAAYAITLLLEAVGIAGLCVDDLSTADIVYSWEPPASGDPGKTMWIIAQSLSDWNNPNVIIRHNRGLPFVFAAGDDTLRYEKSAFGGDPIYSTYALTTGLLEKRQKRNAYGIPIARASELETTGLLAVPTTALYAREIQDRLEHCLGRLPSVPRWPSGKTFAIVLSHDIDLPLRRPAEYLRYVRARLRHGACLTAARSAAGLLRALCHYRRFDPPPERDPNFRFDAWTELERRLGTKSCFFVAVTNCAEATANVNDVGYDFRHPSIIRELKSLLDNGWEVGLHASINARSRPGGIAGERARLEEHLKGYPVRGVRHHYWALDAVFPERTLWEHVAAGFDYDTSFGLNDAPGFRRSIAWPYQPFDPERAETLPILEIPPTIMDGSIFYRPVDPVDAIKAIQNHVQAAKRHGGAVVLDWHLEQMNPARMQHAGPLLANVLGELAGDSDAYWAAPSELYDWWQKRRQMIEMETLHSAIAV